MVKFLDAEQQLSIQVHPKNPVEQPDGTMRAGKAEAWIVLDAAPGSQMLLGLKPDVTETDLRTAAAQGNIEQYLQSYHPHQGDFIFLPPRTIHSLGGGILIAEVQQPSDVTYRLHDWNRRDASGRCRELHLEQAILTADLAAPPVLPHPQNPAIQHETLLHSSHFAIHRHCGFSTWSIPQDERFHVIVMLFGRAILRQERDETLQRGQTIVLPACRSSSELLLEPDAVLLDIFLPAPHEL
jgi:mannose-6-phosphate isomerase